MASEAQATTPTRHPLHRSVLLTLVLSIFFSYVYDAIWLSRVYDYRPGKPMRRFPPLWPIYIGALLYILFINTCLLKIILALGASTSINKHLFYNFHDYIFMILQATVFPLRLYNAIIIHRLFLKSKFCLSYIASILLAFAFPIPVGQYKINKRLTGYRNNMA
jgi:hypothetical protein